ncbi:restriction endonuclease [Candidatus Atribacteria bacterium HGW-Atribacteria-1]|nr:MAG: restriction endonuclease [Candidatus Atribacteria bacterium HGW-Atribacteria-1]
MDKQQAKRIINYIPDAYRQYISSLERIGKFNDGENRIDILIIKLRKETSLASARTMQRNFVAGYLQGKYGSSNEKEAALVAYVAPDEVDWRFSLVKMDYKFEQTPTGKMKVEEEFTPARRWSFLVGENEKSHTAQSRLVSILANDEHNPTLTELEEAFNIESVTKEFFLKYRDLFICTKEELDKEVQNNPNIKNDFEAKGVNTVDFAKKLLGQIVFLYFLQKKGWFGVGRDDAWGTGSKQFLRELFEKKHSGYNNFFNDILEPLFYEALRIGEERKQDDYYYSRFNCKIPFLNGGLFDPIGNYDWVHTDILLPDSLFSNFTKTKEEDMGDGILDIFNRYNFTVREDEPLEKEVAIDPELLGKAYEKFNAIRPDNFEEYQKVLKSGKKGNESKFNKQYGVYYTPREIVHYMCQQSLINYLFTELNSDIISYEKLGDPNLEIFGNKGKKGQIDITIEYREKPLISKEDIDKFLHLGEQVSENEAIALIKEQRIITGIQKSTEKKLQLPESIRKNAELIDQKLADITVCDPAVGSGSFPVGMMSEIVKARNVLTTFIHPPESTLDKEGIKGGLRTPYDFKHQCIEHSLYGVDIDPGAVEIAKLRLWLSLVVDEEDIKNIKPLPNLDYKIVQGNSLISEFMGVNFDSNNEKVSIGLLVKDKTDILIEQFQRKKEEFFNTFNPGRKAILKNEVDNLLIQIFETKLKDQKLEYFRKIMRIEEKYSILPNEQQRDDLINQEKEKLYMETGINLEASEKQLLDFSSGKKIKPFFLWNLYFSEVFHNKGGFDIVIANPPYGATIDELVGVYGKLYPRTTKAFKDIYKIFIDKSLTDLIRKNGILTYIIPNTFMLQPRYKDLREFLLGFDIKIILNLGEDVFEAVVPTSILIVKNGLSKDNVILFGDLSAKSKFAGLNLHEQCFAKISQSVYFNTPSNIFVSDLRGKKGDEETLQNIIKFKDAGINYQRVNVGLGEKGKSDLGKRLLYSGERESVEDIEFWKGEDICSFFIKKKTYRFVRLNTIKSLKYNERVILNKDYFSIRPKLIWRQTAQFPIATIDYKGVWFGRSIQAGILKKEWEKKLSYKYILALMNSSYIRYLYLQQVKELGRVFPQIKLEKLKDLPIKIIFPEEQAPFINLVDQVLSIAKDDDYLYNPDRQSKVEEYEKQINQMVYQLYGLTEDEIKIVEGIKK